MRILIVTYQPVVREGLKRILGEASTIAGFGEAVTTADTLQQIRAGQWDLVILDISPPGGDGFDILRAIRSARPSLPVLVLNVSHEGLYARWTFRAGGAGYITTDSPVEELVKAIRKTAGGGRYVGSALAESLAADLGDEAASAPHELLSMREFEVLTKLASGKTVTQIAEDLRLSVKTISTHRSRTLAKLGVDTTAQLILYAVRHRLVE